MSMRGTKALREHEWQRAQYREGSEDGFADRQGRYSDQYYQRGYRAGQARRQRVTITTDSIWGGNGFGVETMHKAWLYGQQVGEFRKGSLLNNWAFTERGITLHSYADWRAALTRGFEAYLEELRAERRASLPRSPEQAT